MARKSELDAAIDKLDADIYRLQEMRLFLVNAKTAPRQATERKPRKPRAKKADTSGDGAKF